MAITTLDALVAAFPSAQSLYINRPNTASLTASQLWSGWRTAAGSPGQGAIPTTAAIPTKATAGSFDFTNAPVGKKTYLARLNAFPSLAGNEWYLQDRLAHMGGLVGNVITSQTVNVNALDAALDARRGRSDCGDVQWFLEWYTTTGTGATTATVTYTNGAGTSGRTTTVAIAAGMVATRLLPIIGSGGEPIASVQSVQLSPAQGSAGNFGVTAMRNLTSIATFAANTPVALDWASLGLPEVANDACLFLTYMSNTTSSGTLVGTMKLIQG